MKTKPLNLRQFFWVTCLFAIGLVPMGSALAAAALNLAIAPSTGPVAPGQNVTFIITASNTGDMGTGNIILFSSVPNNTTVPAGQDQGAGCNNASATTTDCQTGQNLVWNINLNAGESLTRAFTALVDSSSPPQDGTVITSTASTSIGLSVDAITTVRNAAGLNLMLDSIPNTAASGGGYRYKLNYSNAGSVTVNADLSFSLPDNAVITAASDNGLVNGSSVTWNVGDLSGGGSGIRYVIAQIPVSEVEGTLVLAGANLSDTDGVEPSAIANAITTVDTPLEIAVSTLPDPVQPGQNVSYVITVSNTSVNSTGNAILYARVPNHTLVPCRRPRMKTRVVIM